MLNDREVIKLLEDGLLTPFNKDNITPNGLDLEIRAALDPRTMRSVDHYVLEPGEAVKISLSGEFNTPSDVGGLCFLRSSFVRRGIVASFGVLDAGFKGTFICMLHNLGSESVTIRSGERVVQLILFRLTSSAEAHYGQRSGNYQGMGSVEEDEERVRARSE